MSGTLDDKAGLPRPEVPKGSPYIISEHKDRYGSPISRLS